MEIGKLRLILLISILILPLVGCKEEEQRGTEVKKKKRCDEEMRRRDTR